MLLKKFLLNWIFIGSYLIASLCQRLIVTSANLDLGHAITLELAMNSASNSHELLNKNMPLLCIENLIMTERSLIVLLKYIFLLAI